MESWGKTREDSLSIPIVDVDPLSGYGGARFPSLHTININGRTRMKHTCPSCASTLLPHSRSTEGAFGTKVLVLAT